MVDGSRASFLRSPIRSNRHSHHDLKQGDKQPKDHFPGGNINVTLIKVWSRVLGSKLALAPHPEGV